MLSAIVLSMTLAAILGAMLAPDKGLAPLPVVAMVIGTAVASLPAAMLMRRVGRRPGFLIGALLGIYQGFANYYRFAAVEAAGSDHASKAISLVVAGGVVAAFLGTQIGLWGRDWVAGELFVGAYLAQAGLSLAALLLLTRLNLPNAIATHVGTPRPLREILSQPALRVAIFGAASGYAIMIMVMTATPLAILGCGLPGSSVTPVIQWHVVGMFAPSFFTGALIERYAAPRIMQVGFVLLLGNVVLALSGAGFLNFLSALVLLGVGWNFAFIGGTALLTQTYQPAERLKVQAANEFSVFGFAALATLSAGWLYDRFGWVTLNLAVVPVLLAALIAAIVIERRGLRLATA